ncbi:hypothetical protein Clacol_003758 [Clathrus columnatus]|uniref:Dol-P-Glc:Glc(2)Man(9)GlcNAc(2)-PP-Dol alpha-1,2-glucosyltransferase n=1 Tax=Clathrus columnatus TaxID=1419009 RepID=A0AAV5AC78_9AGAM|nr:hypothetical protein Clacol_003758 [Clathrus columnatus]
MPNPLHYTVFCVVNVIVLKYVNSIVKEPYMDEPFHIPQAQAYCRGEWLIWDPKITTPPGLYVLSILVKNIFMLKCTVSMLRLTPLLSLFALPIVLSRVTSFYHRLPPPQSLLSLTLQDTVIATFPIAWFFGFLYYTDVPSLVFVLLTLMAAFNGSHYFAALLGLLSCLFRQTNIIWVMYAFIVSQLYNLRFSSTYPKILDPPALSTSLFDLPKILVPLLKVLPFLLIPSLPYLLCLFTFAGFVVWNGGIVLGDKSNHTLVFHIPQLYYFISAATFFGWPLFLGFEGGLIGLARVIKYRMIGTRSRILTTLVVTLLMCWSIHKFTIDHPFLLSDNRHYTFYLWRRIFRAHALVPYVLAPFYLIAGWGWFLLIGKDQTYLQTIILPLATLPVLLPTPLLEPRYFLIPYILLRIQIIDLPTWIVGIEWIWYTFINLISMYVFLYKERAGIGRFMW